MAKLAKADDVNDNIFAKGCTVIHGDLCDEQHRLWVIAVDMEYGGLNHLDDIRAIER